MWSGICFCFFKCFDTIEQAYTFVDAEEIEDAIIFVHAGVYVGEFLLIDVNVSIIGAGNVNFMYKCCR